MKKVNTCENGKMEAYGQSTNSVMTTSGSLSSLNPKNKYGPLINQKTPE